MHKIGWRWIPVVSVATFAWAAAHDEVQVPEIIVTPARRPSALTNITQVVGVVHEDEMATIIAPKANLAELLTGQPGTRVTALSRNDANWGSFGGLGPKYSTLMLDGLPIDAFIDPQALDPWALERIEVQRGPASVLYPNYIAHDFAGHQSPLAGTVNLITRTTFPSARTRLDAAWGSYNTWRLRGAHENRVGGLSFFGGAYWEDSDYTNYGTQDSWLNMLDDPAYSKLRLWASARLDLDADARHALSAFGNWMHHDGDAGRPNRGFDHDYVLLQGGYSGELADQVSLALRIGWRVYDRTWQEDNFFNGGDLSLASNNGVEQNIVPMDITLAIDHGEGSRFTIGADAQWADYRTWTDASRRETGNDGQSSQYGLYAQEDWLLGPWVLRGGVRLVGTAHEIERLGGAVPGDTDASWTRLLWSAGARYNGWQGVAPFVNIGSSFLAPALKSVGGTLRPEDRGVPGRGGTASFQIRISTLSPASARMWAFTSSARRTTPRPCAHSSM